MALGISEKIQRAIYNTQKKLHNNWVTVLGSSSTKTFLIDVERDKYNNKSYVIKSYKPFSIMVQFPGNEIPMSTMGDGSNQTSSNVLHLYDILPIVAFVKFDDDVKTGNMFLYKVKLPNGEHQTLVLQFLQPIAQTNRVGVVYLEWVVAPVTDYALLEQAGFKALLKQFKDSDNW
jgi:hypothetical protein